MGARTFRWIVLTMAIGILGGGSCDNVADEEGDTETGDTETEQQKIALIFVGRGEPSVCADGDESITLADGTPFGPFAASLGVPEDAQHTGWAAVYEEMATELTYYFPDLNDNGVPHEFEFTAEGDVPGFFTWEAFHADVCEHYEAFGDYSPHNDVLAEHVDNLEIQLDGVEVETYLAFFDAVPLVADVVWEIVDAGVHEKLVVMPMLPASSTRTVAMELRVHETARMADGMDVLVSPPLFEIPYVRLRLKNAVVEMADYVRQSVPADADDEEIGVLLAARGTPYVPPFAEFGWQAGENFSNLLLEETVFHDEIAAELPWESRIGRTSFDFPSFEDSLAAFEADGFSHVMVVPSAFATAAMNTMWDVADAVVGRAVLPEEGVVVHTRASGLKVYYSAEGYADNEPGRSEFRAGLRSVAKVAVIELLEREN